MNTITSVVKRHPLVTCFVQTDARSWWSAFWIAAWRVDSATSFRSSVSNSPVSRLRLVGVAQPHLWQKAASAGRVARHDEHSRAAVIIGCAQRKPIVLAAVGCDILRIAHGRVKRTVEDLLCHRYRPWPPATHRGDARILKRRISQGIAEPASRNIAENMPDRSSEVPAAAWGSSSSHATWPSIVR
jgi:hypothetical protein